MMDRSMDRRKAVLPEGQYHLGIMVEPGVPAAITSYASEQQSQCRQITLQSDASKLCNLDVLFSTTHTNMLV